jgi:hypothetical protein
MAIRERNCAHCRSQFSYEIKQGPGPLYCGGSCRNAAERHQRETSTISKCEICASLFVPKFGNKLTRTCGDKCYRERQRRVRQAVDAARPQRPPITCKQCGKVFLSSRPSHKAIYCSYKCQGLAQRKEESARARLRMVTVESVNPITVFNRDKWICQLCKRKTPRRLRGSYNARAPELDHIIPLAAGGEHSYRNTQCACRECNGRKRAKPLGQLRLF